MNKNKHAVTIKGTKDGLTFFIDDSCSFDQVIKDLNHKLSSSLMEKDQQLIRVNVQAGNRYLTREQENQIREMIRGKKNFVVHDIVSNVITKQEAMEWKKDSEITPVSKIVRSGQVVDVRGDLLLIGDVNPGGKISATGNIYVMGQLKGIAHAGANGDREAIIAASYMKPSQLRIADLISRSPDYETEGVHMECAYIDQDQEQIVIDRLQVLAKIRSYLSIAERRMANG
ncbi:septum site-determining protein MinC [Melghiribacillus thermohalophilus]|uniref:Probable septum site-determining protein MinC n=1 Tax=Melghiribacillus thermohalophilus TaxID=1324956 RepID=A0A4R3NI13_9BACI|nr:septum site-determining protein MinC [Melghiribacillus thermohalophilus]TCT27128.1 septum site-determining protein MinC [Melghiribacillus thermohalophilus]